LHSPGPSGFVYLEFSWAWLPLLQVFPFPSTLEEVTLHQLSQACLFIYSSHGKWVFPPLLWSFPPTATFTSFPTPGCWVCAAAPAFSGQLVYLLFHEGFHLPTSSALRAPRPLCYVSFCCYCLLFCFFCPGCESVCPGGYADLAQYVCGSTACCLAHLVVCVFPSSLDAGV
jgi:hypothetical protein